MRAQTLIINLKSLFFSRLLNEHREFRDAVGFRQVIIRAELHRLDRRFDRRLPGQHNYFGRILRFVAQTAQKSETVETRHIYIAQKNVEIRFFEQRPSRFAVRSRFDFVSLTAHFLLHDKAQVTFIINY